MGCRSASACTCTVGRRNPGTFHRVRIGSCRPVDREGAGCTRSLQARAFAISMTAGRDDGCIPISSSPGSHARHSPDPHPLALGQKVKALQPVVLRHSCRKEPYGVSKVHCSIKRLPGHRAAHSRTHLTALLRGRHCSRVVRPSIVRVRVDVQDQHLRVVVGCLCLAGA